MKKHRDQKMEIPKQIVLAAVILLMALGTAGCTKDTDSQNEINNQKEADDAFLPDNSIVTPTLNQVTQEPVVNNKSMKTIEGQVDLFAQYSQAIIKTSEGNITVKFYGEDSPMTVNNFMNLAKKGFYNETKFHRVIKDFMIQGGDPLSKESNTSAWGTGGPGYKFADEFNAHKLVAGSLAMANSGPGTNGSQFFIVTAPATSWLDGHHTNFGEVVDGMDIVMKIGSTETGDMDRPTKEIMIKSVELVK